MGMSFSKGHMAWEGGPGLLDSKIFHVCLTRLHVLTFQSLTDSQMWPEALSQSFTQVLSTQGSQDT